MTSSSGVNNRCAIIFLLMLASSASVSESKAHGATRVRRSDDVTLASMQSVMEQQASVIQTLQAKVTSLENSLQAKVTSSENSLQAQQTKITSLENNLKALQTKVDVASSTVAFSARFSGDQDNYMDGVPLGAHQALVFNEAFTNVGNAYSASTGIFTAPVAGTFAFFLSTMSTDNHPSVSLSISKNGAPLDVVWAAGKVDINDQGSSLVSTQLVKGDRVWVRQADGDAVRAGWYTVFTGYLLQAQAQ